MKKIATFALLVLYGCGSINSSRHTNEVQADKEILNMYLAFYLNLDIIKHRKTFLVLDKSEFQLHRNFLPSIRNKMHQYKKSDSLCSKEIQSGKDIAISGPCIFRRNLENFNNVMSEPQSRSFMQYIDSKEQKKYRGLIDAHNVKLTDSSYFYTRHLDAQGMEDNKIKFKGPFYSKDGKLALLEVNDYGSTSTTLFVVFRKCGSHWEMVGNAK